MRNSLQTFFWFLALILVGGVIYYSLGRYSNTGEILLKIVLPIVGILTLAALTIPHYKPEINAHPKNVWYKNTYGNPGVSFMPRAVTWQGWLVDLLSLILSVLILFLAIKAYINNTTNADADLPKLLITLIPILIILFLNLWVRNKHSDLHF